MSSDLSSLESELRGLRPAALSESLLNRLDACCADRWQQLDAAESAVEQQLRSTPAAKLPPHLLATLESTVSTVPFSTQDRKIVRFPQRDAQPRRSHPRWAAAAAVALIGAVTALLVPLKSPDRQQASAPPQPAARPESAANLVPASFNRGLQETSDEGVVWGSNARPHRLLKVVYTDRVTLKDANGKTYQVEQPRVEYIMVPAKTD